MTLEELKKYRAWVEPLAEERESGWKLSGSTEEVLNLAEGMLKIAAIAEATGGVVGVYQALWKDEGGWVADCDRALESLGEETSEDLLSAIDALHDDLTP